MSIRTSYWASATFNPLKYKIMAKWLLYLFAAISLAISFYWGISQNQRLEPWTAFIGAVLFAIGLFVNNDKQNPSNAQKNIFSFFNSSKMKNAGKDNKQFNFFGFGNKQEIENSKKDRV